MYAIFIENAFPAARKNADIESTGINKGKIVNNIGDIFRGFFACFEYHDIVFHTSNTGTCMAFAIAEVYDGEIILSM